jgi:hypothetical protein
MLVYHTQQVKDQVDQSGSGGLLDALVCFALPQSVIHGLPQQMAIDQG